MRNLAIKHSRCFGGGVMRFEGFYLATLSNKRDDGSENDGKKMNLRSSKLNRVYLDPLNKSNAGDFSCS